MSLTFPRPSPDQRLAQPVPTKHGRLDDTRPNHRGQDSPVEPRHARLLEEHGRHSRHAQAFPARLHPFAREKGYAGVRLRYLHGDIRVLLLSSR